ncbi:MAG: ATP-binding protein [Mariprofundaceae bacterium]
MSANQAKLMGTRMLEFSHCNLEPSELIDPNIIFSELKKSHPNINLNISKNIPPMTANKDQFTGIIHAIIENASEACEQDESKISISVSIMKKVNTSKLPIWENLECDNCLCVKVEDFGCGMDSEEVSKAFDPFFSTKFTSRGLGLSSVYGIVKSLKGDINITSEKSLGTTVKVLLPVMPN